MQMLKKCSIWSVFKDHCSGEGIIFLTVPKQIHEILVAYF